jgi:hypothetical protein
MSAEYGRAGGGLLIAVTKSGTNRLRGSAFGYHRNERLNARGSFEDRAQPKSPFDRNEFGGTLGGPLVKDRLFSVDGHASCLATELHAVSAKQAGNVSLR